MDASVSLLGLVEADFHTVSRRAREQEVLGSRKAVSPESQTARLLDAVSKFWSMFYRQHSRKRGVLVEGSYKLPDQPFCREEEDVALHG